jgi:hypothetical protein
MGAVRLTVGSLAGGIGLLPRGLEGDRELRGRRNGIKCSDARVCGSLDLRIKGSELYLMAVKQGSTQEWNIWCHCCLLLEKKISLISMKGWFSFS